MESIVKNEKPVGLENDLHFWLDILQLWRSHLAFLQVRLQGLSQTKEISLTEAEFAYFLEDVALFRETVLLDYQEALRKDLALRQEHAQSLTGARWVEEHDLFERHMRQLKSEYTQLLDRIGKVLEPAEKQHKP